MGSGKLHGSFAVAGVLAADVVPIKNPVTGESLHISLHLREGFEFRQAEMASATFWSKGELEQSHEGRFTAMSYVSYGPQGIIDEESHPQVKAS